MEPTEQQLKNRVIAVDALANPQKPLQVPEAPQSVAPTAPDFSSFIAQAQKLYAPSVQDTQLKQAQDILIRDSASSNRLASYNQAITEAGVPDLQKTVNALSGDLANIQAQRMALQPTVTAKFAGKAPQTFVDQRIAQLDRPLQVNAYFKNAELQAAQGNLLSAKENVNTALELQFADRQDALNAQKQNIEFLQNEIERGTVRADKAINLAIDERNRIIAENQRVIDEEKAVKKEITNLMVTAAQFGADAGTIERIKSATSTQDAILFAGSALRDPKAQLEIAKIKLDMANTRDIMRSRQLADQIAQVTGTDVSSDVFLGMSDDALKSNVVDNITKLKLSEAQGKAVTFALRMIASNKKINQQVQTGKQTQGDYDPTTLLAVGGRLVGSTGANTLDANLRDFVGASLRYESGAAIPETEFESGNKIYSPAKLRITDEEISQYTARRSDAINAMIASTGSAGKYIKQYLENTGDGLRLSQSENNAIDSLFEDDTFNPNDY